MRNGQYSFFNQFISNKSTNLSFINYLKANILTKKMFLFFLQNVFGGCCDLVYNNQLTGGNAGDGTDINPNDECRYAIGDVLCNGPYSEEYRRQARECLYKMLSGRNTDVSLCTEGVRNFITSFCPEVPRFDNAFCVPSKKNICNMEHIFHRLRCFLISHYGSHLLSYQLFCQIWMYFKGDCHKIVVFFTHAIHNTSGFKRLTGWQRPGCDQYYSRGILQILGKSNYEIAGPQYVHCPDLLASLDYYAVCASLRVYSYRVDDCAQTTLCDSWYYLNPEEIQGQNYTYDYYQDRIVNRLNLYIRLTALFCINPQWGRCCYFLQRYLPQMSKCYPLAC